MKSLAVLAAALLAAPTGSALADTAPPFVLAPVGATDKAPAPSGSIAEAVAAAYPRSAAEDGPVLHRLSGPGRSLTLDGEHVVRRLPLFLTAAEAGRATALSVGAITGIDVLETRSTVEIYLNGNLVGTMRPRSDLPATLTARLEPGQVVPGVNEIMFVARHEHRIDCTIAGTYELWTRIIPALTGIAVAPAPIGTVSLADLPSLLGAAADPSALRFALPEPLDDATATRLVRLVNAIVLNGWIAHPTVRLADGTADGSGILVRLAEEAEPSLIPFGDVDGLYLDQGENGAVSGLVLAGDIARMDAALLRLEAAAANRRPNGSGRGLAALRSAVGNPLADKTAYTFASLGFDDLAFAGRHARIDLPAVLPPDFFQADYGDIGLFLDGFVAGGLAAGSDLRIKVNDIETVTIPLSSNRPTAMRQKELRLPLHFFHAGMNVVTIEAELLTEEDTVCAPEAAPVEAERLAIAATSRLVTPKFARVGMTPNLSATFGHASPHALGGAEPTPVFVVGERTQALASTVAYLARMTANAQRVVPYTVALRRPAEAEPGIVVGSAAAMPDWAASLLGEPVPEAAPATPDDEGAEVPVAAAADPSGAAAPFAPDVAPVAPPARSLLDRVRDIFDLSALAKVGTAARTAFGDPIAPNERSYHPSDIVLAQSIAGASSTLDAFTRAVVPSAPPPTVTVVAAPDAETLVAALAGQSEAGVRFAPRGSHYVYDASRDRAVTAGEDATLFATQPPGLFNLRLVAAGWLSHNPKVYVGLIVALVLAAALLIQVLVSRVGGSHGR